MRVFRGQYGRLIATEGPSEVSEGPSKTGMGAVNSWRGFLDPRDNRIRAGAPCAHGDPSVVLGGDK